MKLAGQSILVTGATGAIGQAICRALVADGARVVVHYGRNRDAAEALVASLDGQGWCVSADLSDLDGPQLLWDQAIAAAAGRLTGLVNNAGIRSEVAIDAPMDEWQQVWAREMRVNFLSAVDLSKLAIQHFRDNGGGRVVNMASRAGQRGYTSSAMAFFGISRSMLDDKAELYNHSAYILSGIWRYALTGTALKDGDRGHFAKTFDSFGRASKIMSNVKRDFFGLFEVGEM